MQQLPPSAIILWELLIFISRRLKKNVHHMRQLLSSSELHLSCAFPCKPLSPSSLLFPIFYHSEPQAYLKSAFRVIFPSGSYCPLQKLMNLRSMCSSASSLKSVAKGWKPNCQNFWLELAVFHSWVNLLGLHVGLAASAFQNSGCCKKKMSARQMGTAKVVRAWQALNCACKSNRISVLQCNGA